MPVANIVGGEEGKGLKQALSALEIGGINIAARSIGIAQASLDQSLAYSKERHAFGQPINEFQAIQLKLANMATEIEAGRLLMWWAASRFDAGKRADRESAMAPLYCSELAIRCSLTAMRIHGGYRYSNRMWRVAGGRPHALLPAACHGEAVAPVCAPCGGTGRGAGGARG